MRFSVGLPGLTRYPPTVDHSWAERMTASDFQRVARAADDLGYHALVVPEHIVMPAELAATMGARWPHALTVMAFVAGATTRLAVNSSVIVLPYHNPIVLAKAIATLDVLSGGRVMLAVGIGHAEREFRALGVPFHRRGRMADEFLEAMTVLWTADEPSYHGTFVDFDEVLFEPKPLQRPHPRIWVGGNSAAALRRAARFGQGWMPWLVTPEQLPARLAALRSLPELAGKEHDFDVVMPPLPIRVDEADHRPLDGAPVRRPASAQAVVDAIGALAELGVTWTSIPYPGPPPRSVDDFLEQLAWGAATVMPQFPDT
ncbi:MAG TPA: TIGR03619 family F420-dependent LLM class oxidoreductase [Acidimicrobiales bacterium]|nr:TIGR03619 family F420-dependent LLM class oxidoreductase [Acidimicrobiales bacterium]HLH45911.1 TIGR03619 family F420-dependent LLM class oxidoreductase [Acidimicrobiales bacterium]